MKKLIALALAATLFIATAPARAEEAAAPAAAPAAETPATSGDVSTKYVYEPAHTQIIFSVSHLGFSNSHGRFTKFSGGFNFDPDQPESASADMTIDTNSIVMDSEAWEKHLKNKDFFNVEKYPTMTFKTTKVEKTGDNTGKVTGDLTLLGVTKPVVFDITHNKSGPFPMNNNFISGFSGKATIKRSDFGMNYGLPALGDEVSIILEVEGIRQDATAAEKN